MIRAAPTLGIRFVFVSLLWMALVLGYASEFLYTSPASIPKILFHVGCTERSAWSAHEVPGPLHIASWAKHALMWGSLWRMCLGVCSRICRMP